MEKTRRIAVGCGLAFFCAIGGLNGEQPLRMEVSPSVSRAPAVVTVRVTVATAADNRSLQVIAESPTFYRSSQTQIDGTNSSPVNVFEFRDLPTGTYQITGILMGTRGARATVLRLARVEPPVGSQ
jgi:hypothetical protein